MRNYDEKNSLRKYDTIKRQAMEINKLKEENERLHGVIQQLTRELDEAEEHAFAQQEKLSELLKKVRF